MCTCIHTCIFVYEYVYVNICTYIYTCVYIYKYVYLYVRMHINIHICVCRNMNINIYIYVHINICIFMCVHRYIYIDTYTQIHTYVNTFMSFCVSNYAFLCNKLRLPWSNRMRNRHKTSLRGRASGVTKKLRPTQLVRALAVSWSHPGRSARRYQLMQVLAGPQKNRRGCNTYTYNINAYRHMRGYTTLVKSVRYNCCVCCRNDIL